MMGMVNRVVDWVDARLPVVDAYKRHMSEYYAPKIGRASCRERV